MTKYVPMDLATDFIINDLTKLHTVEEIVAPYYDQEIDVVHCKDCKYFDSMGTGGFFKNVCYRHSSNHRVIHADPMYFCSWGEEGELCVSSFRFPPKTPLEVLSPGMIRNWIHFIQRVMCEGKIPTDGYDLIFLVNYLAYLRDEIEMKTKIEDEE